MRVVEEYSLQYDEVENLLKDCFPVTNSVQDDAFAAEEMNRRISFNTVVANARPARVRKGSADDWGALGGSDWAADIAHVLEDDGQGDTREGGNEPDPNTGVTLPVGAMQTTKVHV